LRRTTGSFGVDISHTKVASFAIEKIGSHELTLVPLISLPYQRCKKENDSWVPGVIATLAHVFGKEARFTGHTNQNATRGKFVLRNLVQGFLCDQPGVMEDWLPSDTLLQQAANILNSPPQLRFTTVILSCRDFEEKNPHFLKTGETESRLDVISYALTAGVPLLIQGPTSASKSLTVHVATVILYGQQPLVSAFSEQK
jgi:hypothetical protein